MYTAEFSKILFFLHKDLGSLNYMLHMFLFQMMPAWSVSVLNTFEEMRSNNFP